MTALIVVALFSAAAADDLRVTARVDRTAVSLNRTVTLTITAEGTMRQVPEPKPMYLTLIREILNSPLQI